MSGPERLQNFKDRAKEKFRRVLGTSTQFADSLSSDPGPLVNVQVGPQPQSLAALDPPDPSVRPVFASPSIVSTTVNHTWTSLKHLQQVLATTSSTFGPLKLVIEDLARCIALHEDAAAARRDYRTLKIELEALFATLSTHFASDLPPTMTASIDNLCSAIQKELVWMTSKGGRGEGGRHWQAKKDLDEALECYRRIEGHLDRLSLNADLSAWKIVDEQATEARLEKLRPSLSACYNSREAAQVRRRECTPNTRKEVLSELSDWRHDQGQGNIYWLNGMAGTGKTTIATSLCKMLERAHELGASFFCTRQLPECRNVNLILPTIAYQLACFSRPFRSALSRALERDPNAHTKALPNQLESLITEPLREVAQTLPTDLVIVLDALDECEDNDGVGHILELLVKHALDLPIRVFVSSRPEPQIRQKLGSTKSQLVLHELEDKIVKDDIEAYLRTELAGISVSESQLGSLIERAGVLFIYAATVVRYIRAKGFHSGQQERINHVLRALPMVSSNKNREIDALYNIVLESAFSGSDLEQSDKDRMRLVLNTVVCAQEPLTINALAGLLQLGDSGWVHDALEPLWSVLHVSESGTDSLVNTLHASFPDYMLDPHRSKGHSCDAKLHNGLIAELSLARIRNNERQFNVCELESSYILDEDVPDLDDRVKQAIPLDLAYACQYWAVHLELGGPSSKRMELLGEFLSMRLLVWMEVLNLVKKMSTGPTLLATARRWCTNQDGASDIKALVHDAWRFTTTFAASPVSFSTPHIYVSMLASWPSSRPIAEHYTPRTKYLVQLRGTAMERRELALLGIIDAEATLASVALSPDGMRIVSGAWDAKIRVWDGRSGLMVLGPLEGHTGCVGSVAFSPDGTRIVSGSEDVRVWDAHTGEMVLGPLEREYVGSVKSVAFSPDSLRVVSSSSDGVRDLGRGFTSMAGSVAFSPDGTYIASTSKLNSIRLWDAQSGQMVSEPLQGHADSVLSFDFSPDGMYMASGSANETIRVWETRGGHMVLEPLVSKDNTIRVWDAQDGQMVLGPLEGHTDSVLSVAFSPDGMRIISGSWDRTIRMWDAQSEQIVPEPLKGHTDSVLSVAFSPDGMRIVSGSMDKTIRVWGAQSGHMLLEPLVGHTDSVNSVAISPDGMFIVSGSSDKTIRLWDAQSGQTRLEPFHGHTGSVESVAFSPDSMYIVSGSADNTMQLWDAQSGHIVLGPMEGHTCQTESVAFSPDGMRIVSGSENGAIRVWDAQSGQTVLGSLEGHTDLIISVAFSPDGKCIVSCSRDKTVRVWDAQNGKLNLGPLQHTEPVLSALFSHDGLRIVSVSGDNTIRVWDAQSGELILGPLNGHIHTIRSVAFSPDGMHIASGFIDTSIRVWCTPSPSTTMPPTVSTSSMAQIRNSTSSFDTLSPWKLDSDGWAVDDCWQLLLWVPHDLRDRLLMPLDEFALSARGSVQLNFAHAKIGRSWTECYLPALPE